jgi:hypothetical protein
MGALSSSRLLSTAARCHLPTCLPTAAQTEKWPPSWVATSHQKGKEFRLPTDNEKEKVVYLCLFPRFVFLVLTLSIIS